MVIAEHEHETAVRCLTPGTGHFFFGYYDKSPWNSTGRWLLAGRAKFADRAPEPDDVLEIGTVNDESDGTFTPLATTRAWNWQQGCMLQWLDERRFIYNDQRDGQFCAVIHDIHGGEQRVLPRPVYAVHAERGLAFSLDFARLHRLRPGYGYAGVKDVTLNDPMPEDAGLYRMDLHTGDSELIFSIADAARLLAEAPGENIQHWLNHVQLAPGGARLALLHRWQTPGAEKPWATRMLTLNADGTQPCPLIDDGVCSHYDWRDDQHVLAFARVPQRGTGFFSFRDRTADVQPLAPDRLTQDGHCSYSPDRRWILNDTYPDPADQRRTLMLIRCADEAIFPIGRFHGPFPADDAIRCDLHPRWHPDGTQVCIDSIHEGRRAMYAIDVRRIVAERS